jgi:flagellar basal body-associated protein FliL
MGKLKMILPAVLLLAGAGAAAWFMVLKPKPAGGHVLPPHVKGDLFALSPEFVVNLTDGHYGKVTVALLLKEAPTAAELSPLSGDMPRLVQDPVIRSTITDDLTGVPSDSLISRAPRGRLRHEILNDLQHATDVEVTDVLFTDVVVQ